MCEPFLKATVSKSQRRWLLITASCVKMSNLFSMNLILPQRSVSASTGWGSCNIWERRWAAVGLDDSNDGPSTTGNIKMVCNLVWQLCYSIRYDVADSRYCGWGHKWYCGWAWFLPVWIGERSTVGVGRDQKGLKSCLTTWNWFCFGVSCKSENRHHLLAEQIPKFRLPAEYQRKRGSQKMEVWTEWATKTPSSR